MKKIMITLVLLSTVLLAGCQLFNRGGNEEIHWCTSPAEEAK